MERWSSDICETPRSMKASAVRECTRDSLESDLRTDLASCNILARRETLLRPSCRLDVSEQRSRDFIVRASKLNIGSGLCLYCRRFVLPRSDRGCRVDPFSAARTPVQANTRATVARRSPALEAPAVVISIWCESSAAEELLYHGPKQPGVRCR